MRVRDTDDYAIVKSSYWDKYGNNAFVERICYDLDEARYVRNSLERCDGIEFTIIKNGKEI